MTKVKFSKSEETSADFIKRRKASLERYLNRVAQHPVLRKDEELRDFLENPADVSIHQLCTAIHCHPPPPPLQLRKASETSALSGAGFMRLMKNVGDSIVKIASKKSESDSVSAWLSHTSCSVLCSPPYLLWVVV